MTTDKFVEINQSEAMLINGGSNKVNSLLKSAEVAAGISLAVATIPGGQAVAVGAAAFSVTYLGLAAVYKVFGW